MRRSSVRNKVVDLYKYNRWANRRVLDALESLGQSEFEADLGGSFSSIYLTINHILWVEWLFLRRWKGLSTEDLLKPFSFNTNEALSESWEDLEREREEYFRELDENTLNETIQYLDTKGQPVTILLWQAIYQAINHSTFHRGQIITKFRQLGKTPPLTDFVRYCRESL